MSYFFLQTKRGYYCTAEKNKPETYRSSPFQGKTPERVSVAKDFDEKGFEVKNKPGYVIAGFRRNLLK